MNHKPLKLEYPLIKSTKDHSHYTIFWTPYSMVPHPKQSATLPVFFLMAGWAGGKNFDYTGSPVRPNLSDFSRNFAVHAPE